ncbi:MAG TPA: putative baseplate assembly protein [Streptosporangiaceae bacterium]|nr:putative baseplate assembly protein [Streptosporangiaceae bacterium]
MPLPAPDLDDRRFQDLVDDAKRLVMRRCPEWTDHNVSDPGVTLIETFAFMTDQLLYRLNRVPDRLYIKFLELIGLRMLPPTPASAPVTFWLSSPAAVPLTISAGTQAGTIRSQATESVVFSTRENLTIVPCTLERIRTPARGEEEDEADDAGGAGTVDRTRLLRSGTGFPVFGTPPRTGDVMLLGLSDAVPGCAVRLDFRGHVEGVGVNPDHPPLVWEAWTGEEWTGCETGADGTGGLNKPGTITVHMPAGHVTSVIGGDRAGWLRARVTDPADGQPPYSASPAVEALTACTVGGTCEAIHAEITRHEVLGESDGVPGQQFALTRSPVLAGAGAPVVETSSEDGWQEWTQVEHFAGSSATDRHFVLDAVSGLVLFGPAVREADGTFRQYGAVPDKGAQVRISRYATGGGAAGNVGERAIQTLKSSIPFVAAVENRHPAHGGVDGETLDQAKARGPLLLRTRSRAVTAEDYEALTREVAPEAARVRCVTAGQGGVAAGAVRVLVVPAAASDEGRILFENLVPPEAMLARIAGRLDEVRVVGTRVAVEPPLYRGITVVARLVARRRVSLQRVTDEAERMLYRFLSPLPGGGHDGDGWPFGRPVTAGEIYGLLQQVRGVELVEDVRLFTADPVTGDRGSEATRIELEPSSLVFSYDHQIRVEAR